MSGHVPAMSTLLSVTSPIKEGPMKAERGGIGNLNPSMGAVRGLCWHDLRALKVRIQEFRLKQWGSLSAPPCTSHEKASNNSNDQIKEHHDFVHHAHTIRGRSFRGRTQYRLQTVLHSGSARF